MRKDFFIGSAIVTVLATGLFFFFHVPKQSCSTLRDPSGMPSTVCAPTKQSPYQRTYLVLHQYFFPKDSCFVNIDTGNVDCQPFLTTGCDQSATTTDCSKIPRPPEESGYFFPATFYTEFAATDQSGRIDEHLFVDNTLIGITACGKIYRTRQIFIDGADVVHRLAALANEGALPKDNEGRVGFCQSLPGEIHLRGIIETSDAKAFTSDDPRLPGKTYLLTVAANSFDINPATGNIYQVGGYDGTLSGPVGALWATYTNDGLGISFMYPPSIKSDSSQWTGSGDTIRAFQATIGLPSGAVMYAYATTKDYSAEKGGFSVGTEGFVVKDGEYHIIRRGNPVSTAFVPDEVWKLEDGSSVPVLYGKNYDPSADYPDPAAKAMVNIPSATFTGIGFVLWNMNNTGSHPVAYDDLTIFKKIITSIEFVK